MIDPAFSTPPTAPSPTAPSPTATGLIGTVRDSHGNVQAAERTDEGKLRETFDQFVGETFYGTMLKSMRSTVGKPAYMHGGRAEEVFQGQLDQMLSQRMAEATGDQFSGPMFELFQLQRSK